MNDSQQFRVEIVKKLPAETLEVINGILRSYNQAANPEFWAKLDGPNQEAKLLNIVVHDRDHEVVGGLLAETSMSWLKIRIMSIREDLRRKGLGALMLDRAEAEARGRGCKYAFVDTMDYQTPEFYRHHGYKVVGSIPDWDSHGHTKFYFTKKL